MKPILPATAAVLLAMSLVACSDNDSDEATATGMTSDQSSMNADSGTQMNDESSMSNNEMNSDMNSDMGGDMSAGSMGEESMNGGMQSDDMSGNAQSEEDRPQAAIAVLNGLEGHEDVTATVRFEPQNGGLSYTAEASNLPEGPHAYHVHLYGDCSASDGTSAGTHFNFEGSSKNPPENIDRITGNLGELEGPGSASDEGTLNNVSLTGPKSIIGRSIIIHEQGNDESQPPMGDAGSRLACGVIGIDEAENGDSAGSDSSQPEQASVMSDSGSNSSGNAAQTDSADPAAAANSGDSM